MSNISIKVIPADWLETTIEEILTPQEDGKLIHQGWSPRCHTVNAPEGEWGVLKTTAIQDGYYLEEANKWLPEDKEPKPRIEVKAGDLLMTNAGPRARCGITTLVRKTRSKLMISGKMYRMRFNEKYIHPKYIEACLRSDSVRREIDSRKTGMSESGLNLTQERFLSVPLILCPYSEQTRIVKKLDELLAQVDTIKARIDAIPTILKHFRQSVLAAAVSGKLTEEWRGSSDYLEVNEFLEIPVGWQILRVEDLVEYVTSGSRGWAKYYSDNGSLFVRSQDINTDELKIEQAAYVDLPEQAEGRRTKVQVEDILITITGANVTKCARVKIALEDAYISQHVALLRLSDSNASQFIELALKAENAGRKQLTDMAYGGGKPGLNLQNIKEVRFGVPSGVEQKLIVGKVGELFAFADQIEQRVKDAQSRINNLTQSILAKAFRGELVPQDPNDEPADVLLERIKKEREAAAKLVKAAKKVVKKKVKA